MYTHILHGPPKYYTFLVFFKYFTNLLFLTQYRTRDGKRRGKKESEIYYLRKKRWKKRRGNKPMAEVDNKFKKSLLELMNELLRKRLKAVKYLQKSVFDS